MGDEHKFELQAKAENLASFRKELGELLVLSGLDEKKKHEVTLAVDEAMANVIRHGYQGSCGPIEIFFRNYADRIEVLIRDFGKCFDPTQIPAPELPPKKPGGLGVYFIRTVMDKVQYCVGHNQSNELLLTKYKAS